MFPFRSDLQRQSYRQVLESIKTTYPGLLPHTALAVLKMLKHENFEDELKAVPRTENCLFV